MTVEILWYPDFKCQSTEFPMAKNPVKSWLQVVLSETSWSEKANPGSPFLGHIQISHGPVLDSYNPWLSRTGLWEIWLCPKKAEPGSAFSDQPVSGNTSWHNKNQTLIFCYMHDSQGHQITIYISMSGTKGTGKSSDQGQRTLPA